MNIELRWLQKASTTTEAPRLQFRVMGDWPNWLEWQDVPTEIAKPSEPAAPMTPNSIFGDTRPSIHVEKWPSL